MRNTRLLLVPFLFLLAFGCTPLEKQRQIDELRYKIRDQQRIIAGQTDTIATLRAERESLKKRVQFLELQVKGLQGQLEAKDQERGKAAEQLDALKKRLEELAKEEPKSFQWSAEEGSLRVAAEVLFASGKADLIDSGKKALEKVANILKGGKELIRVDGHTDSDPIKYSQWEDNWHLAGARARTVLKFLVKQGVERNRIFFAGYADTRPRADNKTAAGKRLNRRVEILPLPPYLATSPRGQKPATKQKVKK